LTPYYSDDLVTLYHGDWREVAGLEADVIISDPPYPNSAGHFDAAVESAEEFCRSFAADHWLVFWDEMGQPPVPLPLVARHIWHRTNTNRPDNYEPIFEFCADGKKRPSRVLPYAVIYLGLTGCYEATGHPTQKNVRLMRALVKMTRGVILDPFAGSGTTLRAAKDLGRSAIGFEVEERWCEVTAQRLAQEVLDLSVDVTSAIQPQIMLDIPA
jgi:site-specific DNA-methyltransferase (adenine-specific)